MDATKNALTLQQVNERLLAIAGELREKIPQLIKREWEYESYFSQTMMNSGMGNQEKREAEAKLACDAQGLLAPVQELKGDVRVLFQEKDLLIEYGKNLRVLTMGREE